MKSCLLIDYMLSFFFINYIYTYLFPLQDDDLLFVWFKTGKIKRHKYCLFVHVGFHFSGRMYL